MEPSKENSEIEDNKELVYQQKIEELQRFIPILEKVIAKGSQLGEEKFKKSSIEKMERVHDLIKNRKKVSLANLLKFEDFLIKFSGNGYSSSSKNDESIKTEHIVDAKIKTEIVDATPDSPPASETFRAHTPIEIPTERRGNSRDKYHYSRSTTSADRHRSNDMYYKRSSPSRYDRNLNRSTNEYDRNSNRSTNEYDRRNDYRRDNRNYDSRRNISEERREYRNDQKDKKPVSSTYQNQSKSVFDRLGQKVPEYDRSQFALRPSPEKSTFTADEIKEMHTANRDRFGEPEENLDAKKLDELIIMREKLQLSYESSTKNSYDPKKTEFLWKTSETSDTKSEVKDTKIKAISSNNTSTNTESKSMSDTSISKVDNSKQTKLKSTSAASSFSFTNEFNTLKSMKPLQPFEIQSLEKPSTSFKLNNKSPTKVQSPIYGNANNAITSTDRPLSPTALNAVDQVLQNGFEQTNNEVSTYGYNESTRLAYKYNPKPRRAPDNEPSMSDFRHMTITASKSSENTIGTMKPTATATLSNSDPRLRSRDPRIANVSPHSIVAPMQRDFTGSINPFAINPIRNGSFAQDEMSAYSNTSDQYGQSSNISPRGNFITSPNNGLNQQSYGNNSMNFNTWNATSSNTANEPRTYGEYRRTKELQNKLQQPKSSHSNRSTSNNNWQQSDRTNQTNDSDKSNSTATSSTLPKSQLDIVYRTGNYAATPIPNLKVDKFKIPKIQSNNPSNKNSTDHFDNDSDDCDNNLVIDEDRQESDSSAENVIIRKKRNSNNKNADQLNTKKTTDMTAATNNNRSPKDKDVAKAGQDSHLRSPTSDDRSSRDPRLNKSRKSIDIISVVTIDPNKDSAALKDILQRRDPRLNRSKDIEPIESLSTVDPVFNSNLEVNNDIPECSNESTSVECEPKSQSHSANSSMHTEKIDESKKNEVVKGLVKECLKYKMNDQTSKENFLNMLQGVLDEKSFNDISGFLANLNKDDNDKCESESVTESNTDITEEIENASNNNNDAIVKKAKPSKRKNELQKLNEDIRTMFISDGVLTANGRRICTMLKDSNNKTEAPVVKKVPPTKITTKWKVSKSTAVTDEPKDERKVQPLRIVKRRVTMADPTELELDRSESEIPFKRQTRLAVQLQKVDNDELLRPIKVVPIPNTDKPQPTSKIRSRRKTTCEVPAEPIEPIVPAEIKEEKRTPMGRRKRTVSASIASRDESLDSNSTTTSQERKTPVRRSKWASGILPKKKKKVKPDPTKNTNIEHHCQNTQFLKQCLICDAKILHSVPHYTSTHPNSEVMISRLAPHVAKKLHNGKLSTSYSFERDGIKYTFTCIFCEKEKSVILSSWRSHFATHTGEYDITCATCNQRVIRGNFKTHKCPSGGVKQAVDNEDTPFIHAMVVSVCKLCNFAQFNENRMKKHLIDQHNIENPVNNYTLLKLLDVKPKRTRTHRPSETESVESSIKDEQTDMSDDVEMPMVLAQNDIKEDERQQDVQEDVPQNPDAFLSPAKKYDVLFDEDTMKIMNDMSFSAPDVNDTQQQQPRRVSMADRLNKRFNAAARAEAAEKEQKDDDHAAAEENDIDLSIPIVMKMDDGTCIANDTNEIISIDDDILREDLCFDDPQMNKSQNNQRKIDEPKIEQSQIDEFQRDQLKNEQSQMDESKRDESDNNDRPQNDEPQIDDNEWESYSSSSDLDEMPADIAKQKNKKNTGIHDTVKRLSEKLRNGQKLTKKSSNEKIKLLTDIKPEPNVEDEKVENEKVENEKVASTEPETPNVSTDLTLVNQVASSEQSAHNDEIVKEKNTIEANKNNEIDERQNVVESNESTVVAASATTTIPTTTPITIPKTTIQQTTRNGESNEHGSNNNLPMLRTYLAPNSIAANNQMNGNNKESIPNDHPQIKPNEPNMANVKVLNRIDNIGYTNWNGNIEYCCLIQNCGYENFSASNLVKHIHSHTNQWAGYCFMCDRNIYDDVRALAVELKHMFDAHLRKKSSVQVSDAADDSQTQRPMIKFRRLSGDKLSKVTNEQNVSSPLLKLLQPSTQLAAINLSQSNITKPVATESFLKITKVTGGIPFIDDTKMVENDASNTIPTSSSSSSSSSLLPVQPPPQQRSPIIIKITETIPTVIINLKPWTTNEPKKIASQCKEMLRDITLYALYKCMGASCHYSTENADQMLIHLNNHEAHIETNSNVDTLSWLECCYCEEFADSCNVLVRHIQDEHSSSIFQCPYCFYRSCAAPNILIHLNQYHTNKEQSVLVCRGKSKLMTHEIPVIVKCRADNVRPLICSCNLTFYVMQVFVDHLASTKAHRDNITCQFCNTTVPRNTVAQHMTLHGIGLFECIYCPYGSCNIEKIQLHMCNQHPTKLLYVCVRVMGKDKDLSQIDICNIESTEFVYIGDLVNQNLLRRSVYTDDQLNCMSPYLDVSRTNAINANNATIPIYQPNATPSDAMNFEIANVNSIAPDTFLAGESTAEQRSSAAAAAANATTTIATASGCGVTLNNIPSLSSMRTMYSIDNFDVYFEKLDTMASQQALRYAEPSTSKNQSSASYLSQVEDKQIPVITTDLSRPSQLQDEIDNAAYALIKGTGLEGPDLYRCGMPECDGTGVDSIYFNVHLLKHTYTGQKGFKCYHCSSVSKNIVGLKYHIKVHGIHRYFCYYCDFTGPVMNFTLKHMNETHKKNQVVTIPLNPAKNDQNKDMFVICPRGLRHEELNRFGLKLLERYNHKLANRKKSFAPDELDLLPRQAIFNDELTCAVCHFKTKVRTNMIRHLDKHRNNVNVSKVDPINPVPCLDTGEKHFDKMINLAGSSNDGRTTTITSTSTSSSASAAATANMGDAYAFVGPMQRLVCGAKGCRYLTTDDNMLRFHLQTLHPFVQNYKCPHCQLEICKQTLNVEEIFNHYRMHDTKLYRCPKLCFIHYNKLVVQAHIDNKHSGCRDAIITIIREEKPIAETNPSGNEVPKVSKWHCTLCFHTFDLRSEIQQHMKNEHKINYQYQCEVCNVQSNVKATITDHMESKHGDTKKTVKYFYEKVEITDTRPIWRRDDPNKVKHIRGILLEDEEESIPTPPKRGSRKSRSKSTLFSSPPPPPPPPPTATNSLRQSIDGPIQPTVRRNSIKLNLAPKTNLRQPNSNNNDDDVEIFNPTVEQTFIDEVIISDDDDDQIPEPKSATTIKSIPEEIKVEAKTNSSNTLAETAAATTTTTTSPTTKTTEQPPVITPPQPTSSETAAAAAAIVSETNLIPPPPPNAASVAQIQASAQLPSAATTPTITTTEAPSGEIDINKPYGCSICKTYNASSVQLVKEHHQRKHPKDKFTVYIQTPIQMEASNQNSQITLSPSSSSSSSSSSSVPLSEIETIPETPQKLPTQTEKLHNQDIIYLCYYCTYNTNDIKNVYLHWFRSHKNPKPSNPNEQETDCPFWFRITKNVKCFYCDKTASYKEIRLHKCQAHSNEKFVSINATDHTQCGECDFHYKHDQSEIKEHYKQKHQLTPFSQMRNEPIDFLTDDFLDNIMRMGYRGEHKCKHCNQQFKYFDDYAMHHKEKHPTLENRKEMVQRPMQYGCQQCNKMMDNVWDMIEHIRDHLVLYQCKFCLAKFSHLYMIKQHHDVKHGVQDETYRNVDVANHLDLFINMRYYFPNGLVLTNGDLNNTKYEKMNEIIVYVNKLNEDELKKIDNEQQAKATLNVASSTTTTTAAAAAATTTTTTKPNKENGEKSESELESSQENIIIRRKSRSGSQLGKMSTTKKRPLRIDDNDDDDDDDSNNDDDVKDVDYMRKSYMRKSNNKPKKRTTRRQTRDLSPSGASSSEDEDAKVSKPTKTEKSNVARKTSVATAPSPLPKRMATNSNTNSNSNTNTTTTNNNNKKKPSSRPKTMKPYSYYGIKPEPVDLSKVKTYMNVAGSDMPISCERFATFLNLNPTICLRPICTMAEYYVANNIIKPPPKKKRKK